MESSTLRTVQLAQLEVAKEFKRICEENGLRYIIDCGSLIGAVRHKGFIPWDDDMDFSMPREDYDRFFSIMKERNGRGYTAMRWDMTEGYPLAFGKLTKDGTVYREEKMEKSFGIYVDIFPFDVIHPEKERKRNRFLLMSYRAMIRAKCGCRTYMQDGKILPKKFLKNLPYILLSAFFGTQTLVGKYDRLATKYNTSGGGHLTAQGEKKPFSWHSCRSYYDRRCMVEFEGTEFAAPADYDTYLRKLYGDYMQLPPEAERENHHGIVEVKV